MATKEKVRIEITPPNFQILPIRVEGTAPLMLHKFSEKMRKQIHEKQTTKDATKKKREPKDYAAEFNAARYIAEGKKWDGIPAGAFRAAGPCKEWAGLLEVGAGRPTALENSCRPRDGFGGRSPPHAGRVGRSPRRCWY